MDISTFYALFSATCFALLGFWWNLLQGNPHWLRNPETRSAVGGVYLSFLLPALMGLFAQIGGSESPVFWRVSFVVIAIVGCVSTVTLLRRARAAEGAGAFARYWWGAALVYALVAVLGVAPEIARAIGITPLQAEATLLIMLVALAHALVWEFMTNDAYTQDS